MINFAKKINNEKEAMGEVAKLLEKRTQIIKDLTYPLAYDQRQYSVAMKSRLTNRIKVIRKKYPVI